MGRVGSVDSEEVRPDSEEDHQVSTEDRPGCMDHREYTGDHSRTIANRATSCLNPGPTTPLSLVLCPSFSSNVWFSRSLSVLWSGSNPLLSAELFSDPLLSAELLSDLNQGEWCSDELTITNRNLTSDMQYDASTSCLFRIIQETLSSERQGIVTQQLIRQVFQIECVLNIFNILLTNFYFSIHFLLTTISKCYT